MVTWYADGEVEAYNPQGGTPSSGMYLLVKETTGCVDTQGISSMQYNVGSPTPQQVNTNRLNVTVRVNYTAADFSAHPGAFLTATLFMANESLFAPGVTPTPAQILSKGAILRAWRATQHATAPGNIDFVILGPKPNDLQANTKVWLLAVPTAAINMGYAANYVNDPPVGSPNANAKGISMWANRTPLAPKITSPNPGSIVSAGASITLSYTSNDPDSFAGRTDQNYTDVAGVQVQYAPLPTQQSPNPTWTDLPFTNSNGGPGPGYFITGRFDNPTHGPGFFNDGAEPLVTLLTQGILCGANTTANQVGNLPSGDWQLRLRTFDFGHPLRAVYGALGTNDGTYTPDTFPATNTSPWSASLKISVTSQVLPPVPLSPINNNAIVQGLPVTLSWQYRNTHNPPFLQKSRTVEVRKVGDVGWTTLVAGDSPDTFVTSTGSFPFVATTQYEWRVQVTDTDNVISNFSGSGFFWIVPSPSSSGTRPIPSSTIDGATLGCGTHRAFIYRRGGKDRVGEITGITHIDWARIRDDISTAEIVVSGWGIDCGNLLARLQTWAYELVIYRSNGYTTDRVWEGPITLLTYEVDKVTIDAKDVMGYAYRRIVKQDMSDTAISDTVTSRAVRILQNVFAPDDPNILPYVVALTRDDDTKENRSLLPYTKTAYEEIDDMAANQGLDYTVIGRSIMVWGTKHQIGVLPEFQDNDLGAPPIVSEYGMDMANIYAVGDGNGVYGTATRGGVVVNADSVTNPDPVYGLVEMLSSSWSSDSGDPAPAVSDADLPSTQQSFADSAESAIGDRYPPPVIVRIPDNTTLNPAMVISIQQLVPGVAIPLRSTGTLRSVAATQKLDSVKVVEESGNESISIVLSPFNSADADIAADPDGEGDV